MPTSTSATPTASAPAEVAAAAGSSSSSSTYSTNSSSASKSSSSSRSSSSSSSNNNTTSLTLKSKRKESALTTTPTSNKKHRISLGVTPLVSTAAALRQNAADSTNSQSTSEKVKVGFENNNDGDDGVDNYIDNKFSIGLNNKHRNTSQGSQTIESDVYTYDSRLHLPCDKVISDIVSALTKKEEECDNIQRENGENKSKLSKSLKSILL